ncbi:hypothetical protein [Bacillus sp. JJ1474]|uniref:hypothetical protein n=1 Tax=Bacillus sp. JJ1474 TaxID=3122955 RepID=UPI00300089EF
MPVINWNISHTASIERKIEYLKSVMEESDSSCIVVLEEVIEEIKDKTGLMFAHCAIKYGADFLISNDFKSGCLI